MNCFGISARMLLAACLGTWDGSAPCAATVQSILVPPSKVPPQEGPRQGDLSITAHISVVFTDG